uniref:Leucine-rich repeat domain-containing protein n=1 Tax=Thermosporothrix sp. COM3 TaxID=2490863 RepID=A0A455SEN2_9CHLR|nr:hypothetical protein KTC_05590 [Thermosporothrix sp. COM3]
MDIAKLLSSAHLSHEPAFLHEAVHHASEAELEALVLALLERGDNEPSYQRLLHFQALACLSALPAHSPLLPRLHATLLTLFPPQHFYETELLGMAGSALVEPVQNLLLQTDTADTSRWQAGLHTLLHIGGEQAMNALHRLLEWLRSREEFTAIVQPLQDEWLEGWKSRRFPPERFARDVLVPIFGATPRLLLRDLSGSLSGLQYLSHLAQLKIYESPELTSIQALHGHPNLRQVQLVGCPRLRDATIFTTLPRLELLDLARCPGLYDIDVLACLSPHIELNLWFSRSLKGLHRLSGLTELSCDALEDAAELAQLPGLKRLFLDGYSYSDGTHMPRPRNLHVLSTLSGLESLTLRDLTLDTLAVLAPLTRLKELHLYGCQPFTDLSPLTALSELETLSITDSLIEDIRPLAELPRLRKLSLSLNTRIKRLDMLPHVETLDISGCTNLDLQALQAVLRSSSLKELFIGENRGELDYAALPPNIDIRQ